MIGSIVSNLGVGRLAAVAAAMGVACAAHAQDLTPRAKGQAKPVAIVNATVHRVSGPTLERGFVVINERDIAAVGPQETMDKAITPQTHRIIDAAGRHVYPGLIGAYTQLGLTEATAVRASNDMSEAGGVTPEVRAVVAVNPDSTLLPVTRSNGVLLAGVFPTGGTVPGRAGVIKLDGWTWEQMTVRGDAGLIVNWPMTRTISAWWMNRSEEEQKRDIDATLKSIEDLFTHARAYGAVPNAGEKRTTDLRLEAMQPLFSSDAAAKRPVFIAAQDVDQIMQAVAFGDRHGVRVVIIGGRDAALCAEELKKRSIGVIVDGTVRFPKRDDAPYDDAFTLPARLEAAGLKWCLGSGEEPGHERNLPYSAALAAAYGLDRALAIRSITLSTAQILGIADRFGSLEAGKSATLIISDGDMLEVSSNVTAAFIDGAEVNLDNKQRVQERRYREKYGELNRHQ